MKIRPPVIAALMLSLLSTAAFAQSQRMVFINGIRLSNAQLVTLQRMHCAMIPNGAYWLNPRTGAWGFAGNGATRGYLGEPCRRGQVPRRKSLSERGLLYTPGDLNFR